MTETETDDIEKIFKTGNISDTEDVGSTNTSLEESVLEKIRNN